MKDFTKQTQDQFQAIPVYNKANWFNEMKYQELLQSFEVNISFIPKDNSSLFNIIRIII